MREAAWRGEQQEEDQIQQQKMQSPMNWRNGEIFAGLSWEL